MIDLDEQIRAGEAAQPTDFWATRSFMTAAEAAALVIRADLLGDSGQTYWLDAGRPVTIVDLAMLRHDVAVGDAGSALATLEAAVPDYQESDLAIALASKTSVGRALAAAVPAQIHRSASPVPVRARA